MRFTKMHGIGNDFIVLDAIHNEIRDPLALAKRLCRRRFDIGADGLILICESQIADARMRIINSDGTEADMCGNGIRCAAKYCYDSGLCRRERFDIETRSGVKHIALALEGGRAVGATVDMGAPAFEPARFPLASKSNRFETELLGRPAHFFCAWTGVPHAVTFDLYPDDAQFLEIAPKMERHPIFPEGCNIEFCRVDDRQNLSVKVWERGAGATLACGTGSCAVLAAGVLLGLCERSARIHLPGGTLSDRWADDGHLYMTGPAETVCSGEFEP